MFHLKSTSPYSVENMHIFYEVIKNELSNVVHSAIPNILPNL